MSHYLRCDVCGKDLGQLNGLRLERIGDGETKVSVYGRREDWDICSSACLESLASALKARS